MGLVRNDYLKGCNNLVVESRLGYKGIYFLCLAALDSWTGIGSNMRGGLSDDL